VTPFNLGLTTLYSVCLTNDCALEEELRDWWSGNILPRRSPKLDDCQRSM